MYQDSYLRAAMTNTDIVIGNREQSSGSMAIILSDCEHDGVPGGISAGGLQNSVT